MMEPRDEHDDDDDDTMHLVSNAKLTSMRIHMDSDDDDDDAPIMNRKWAVLVLVIMLVAAALSVRVPSGKTTGIVHFQCPTRVDEANNISPEDVGAYEAAAKEIQSNITHFMETFRNSTFDEWGRTYDKVKRGMYHWKKTHFPSNLNDGDSVYESACGIGLNLYMTLEIVKEVKNITNLVVYGNEYVAASADVANALFDNHPASNAVKGTICPGDSANIYFVPSNAFDLVYTGYISPITDPLHLDKGDANANLEYLKQACKGHDWMSAKLSELAQGVQDDFYGKWVAEMVRIAKPGKPVIIEQVSMPFCDEFLDWGGVGREWWKPAIKKYGWDVDPSSIEMEKDSLYKNRYHVFMRKNCEKA